MQAVRDNGATLLPIDSEHNAIFQCMPPNYRAGETPPYASKILLTCSGGPFRSWSAQQMQGITVEQAVAHPNWSMGRKISVDSATLMNKGLELIEACWLFDTPASGIEVVIHPQSVVHSLVQYNDGSVLAQLGNPDMRTPIAYGLAWPERVGAGVADLDLTAIATLDFEAPDTTRFPCLGLAQAAAAEGGSHSVVLNAANEVAVEAFLQESIAFAAIAAVIGKTMQMAGPIEPASISEVLEIDAQARAFAQKIITDKLY
jgi:1-deoxy-D-xylulose-5-phosphate reductoisomerase